MLQNKDESYDARREAAFSLGAIGGDQSLKLLTTYQDSPDPYLAEICKEGVQKIKPGLISAETKSAH